MEEGQRIMVWKIMIKDISNENLMLTWVIFFSPKWVMIVLNRKNLIGSDMKEEAKN